MLLSIGEQESVALMAIALNSLGVPAISLNAFQVGMHTTSAYSAARFKRVDTDRLVHELDAGKVVIVTGFQGVNKYDDVTTLGRGGSDTTAVALAATLHADKCEIFTDVDGVYTADPRIVKNARKLKEISYDEMLEMATLGAQVLHNRSVEMAKKYGVTLVVRSSLNESEGTLVREVNNVEKMLVSGVACDKNAARIALIGVKNEPGVAFKIFDELSRKNINVDMILQSVGRDDTKDISFTVDQEEAKNAVAVLKENRERLTIQKIEDEVNVAKLSVVGAGMQSNSGVAAKMFEALYDVGVNIRMISTSEIRITVLIDLEDTDRAMRAVHDKFLPDED
jgi:aspartate kinase